MSLGQTIKRFRQSTGMSQRQLAKNAGISVSYLSLIESDQREPTISVLRTIAGHLGAPATILIAVALVQDLGKTTREARIVEKLLEAAHLNMATDATNGTE